MSRYLLRYQVVAANLKENLHAYTSSSSSNEPRNGMYSLDILGLPT